MLLPSMPTLRKRLVRALLAVLPPLLVLACGTPPTPEQADTIRAVCAPGAAVARELALLACRDDKCRAAVRALDALAAGTCRQLPRAAPVGDAGAGGGPGVHVAPPSAYGNRVVLR